MKNNSIGIDIGGTNTVCGLVTPEGKCLKKNNFKTQDFPKIENYVAKLAENIAELTSDSCGKLGQMQPLPVGIGAPNANYFSGFIDDAPNLPWKGRISLCDMLAEKLAWSRDKFAITNDANAAAIGEKTYGKAKNLDDFIVVTLGTGVGSGIFSGGKLLYGSTGAAGELGHIITERDGRQCGCGRCGCLETYCSATGVARTYREMNPAAKNITSREIAGLAHSGDEIARKVFDFTGEMLGFALANAVAISSPSHIFLLGGLAQSGELIFAPTRKVMDKYMLNIFKGTVSLEVSGIDGENAAILGAAAVRNIKEENI